MSARVKAAAEHEHEPWQLRYAEGSGYYCGACGRTLSAVVAALREEA